MRTIVLLFVAVLMAACASRSSSVVVTNTADYAVKEKPLLIKRSDLESKPVSIDPKKIPFLKDSSGNLLVCQLDDVDGDGKWDELFTLVDLEANETKSYTLTFLSPSKASEVKIRTNIRFADKEDAGKEFAQAERLKSNDSPTSQKTFQFEGPGWENDVVGFRNYFDARNGIDIWGKITTEMVLDRVGLKDGPSYHEMQDWGMDVLKVANSLGAGAIALQTESGLHRIGPDSEGTFTLVTEGPLRSTFDLDFKGMVVDGKSFDIKHRICIIAGKPWYKSVVTVKGEGSPKLVTGIVNLHADSVYSASTENYAYMYTHDHQGFEGEVLGMAIILPLNTIVVNTAPEEGEGITQTFYTSMETGEKPNVFFFMVGWERQDSRWSDREGFEQGIAEQGKLIAAKLDVSIQ
jgi:hypothetical protein